jgi:hypothetical protein
MQSMAMALPVRPGKTEDARRFADEIRSRRSGEASRGQSASGIQREEWFLQTGPAGEMLVGFFEADDPARILSTVKESDSEFMQWFKQRLQDITGVDLNAADFRMPEPLVQSRAA